MAGSVEDTIRELADEGHSRTAVCEILNISRHTLRQYLAEMDPPPNWAGQGNYLGNKLANEAQRGTCTPQQVASARIASAAWQSKTARTYRGFTGSVDQIAKRFGANVHSQTIYRRLRSGMDLEAAMTLPPQKGNRFTARRAVN